MARKKVVDEVKETVQDVVEPVVEITEPEITEAGEQTSTDGLDLINEQSVQLDIHVKNIVKIFGALAIVTNEGYGDVYVDGELLGHGEEKSFEDVDALVLYSASRPVVKIQQYK